MSELTLLVLDIVSPFYVLSANNGGLRVSASNLDDRQHGGIHCFARPTGEEGLTIWLTTRPCVTA
jgi:hypothetical protein